jgi:hypothetical protein
MKLATTIALVCLTLAAPARAAPVDMSTQTCEDWLDATEEEQDQMVAWLHGFIAGRSTSTMYNLASGRADATSLKLYCQGHKTVGLTSAASQWKH